MSSLSYSLVPGNALDTWSFLFTMHTNTLATLPSACSPVYSLKELLPSDYDADTQLLGSAVLILSQSQRPLGFPIGRSELYILSPRQVTPSEIKFHFCS